MKTAYRIVCANNPVIYTDPSGHIFGIDDLIIGAVIGAVIGGTTSAVTGGNVWQGMALGAVSGAIFAGVGGYVGEAVAHMGVPGGVGPPTAGWATAGKVAGGIAGGASAGAASSAMTGGNIGQGVLTGGIMGGLGSFGIPNYAPFGDSAAGSIGNRLFNSSLTGGAFGAAYAGVTGGNIWQGAGQGAMAWGIGEAANMGIGHTVGFIASGGNAPTYENGAFYYDANVGGWITFGNVVTGPRNGLGETLIINGMKDPYGRTYGQHEMGHMPQGTILGPAYIPAHAASLTVGGFVGMFTGSGVVTGSHRYGLLERYWHPVPSY